MMKKASLPVRNGPAVTSTRPSPGVDRKRLLMLLRRHFGHDSFRGRQLEVIETVLSGKDCFCLMPTGGGKSMCYELPALARPGVVLVVSPLIALMESQVSALKAQDISAEYLSSTQTAVVKSKIYEELESGKPSLRLLYVTPELITTAGFMTKLKKLHGRGLMTLIAIDEAHCISSWGHDFRPSYRKLSTLRSNLPGIPLLALTATASAKVQKDVVSSLGLREPRLLISSFNRPNIFYEVRFKNLLKNSYADLLNMLKTAPAECAIIYCHSRATCDDIGARLLKDRISCRVYHAGMSDKARSQSLDDWTSGKVPVVVATVAFGMGIDRKDVRLVCHFNLPKTLEGFYQESGRAGRDRKPARSVLYYGLDDKSTMEFILKKEAAKQKKSKPMGSGAPENAALEAFIQMLHYCEGRGCRRQTLLAHFGEKVSSELCSKTCDACRFPQRISQQLEELAEHSRTYSRALSASVVFSKQSNPDHWHASGGEFWKHEDEEEQSLDEISSSDDEAAEAAAAVASRQRGTLRKVDALLRAEEEFMSKQGAPDEKASVQEKKRVSQSTRDIAIERLVCGVVKAYERMGMQDCVPTPQTAAATLEGDCYKKYSKAGRSFYNSQVASTMRWLSSCTSQEMLIRVPITKVAEGNDSSSLKSSRDLVRNEPANPGIQEVQASPDFALETGPPISLPKIPSMHEFMKQGKPKKARLRL